MENFKSSELKVRSNFVVVAPIEKEDTTTSAGILLPANKFEPIKIGKVIAIGPGGKTKSGKIRPMTVEVGDKVLYSMHDGDSANKVFKVDDKKCFFIRERDLLLSLTDEHTIR